MYPQGYICLSEGVHLRLAIDDKMYSHIICFQIFIHMSVIVIFKNHDTLIVRYKYMKNHDKIFFNGQWVYCFI